MSNTFFWPGRSVFNKAGERESVTTTPEDKKTEEKIACLPGPRIERQHPPQATDRLFYTGFEEQKGTRELVKKKQISAQAAAANQIASIGNFPVQNLRWLIPFSQLFLRFDLAFIANIPFTTPAHCVCVPDPSLLFLPYSTVCAHFVFLSRSKWCLSYFIKKTHPLSFLLSLSPSCSSRFQLVLRACFLWQHCSHWSKPIDK